MSIKGLTDRGSMFPEIGQIRKGGKKPDGKHIGPDLNYFRVEFDEGDKRAAMFAGTYGDQPKEINILFPFNEIDRFWDAWFEAYTAGRMVARSDGEFFTYLVDVKTGAVLVMNGVDKDGNKVAHREIVGYVENAERGTRNPIKMKPTGRLKVVVPELQSLAYLTVHTTSIYDLMNISSQLEAIQGMNNGRIAGVPLVMRRRKKMISTPGADGARVRREKYLISIEADPDWVKKMLEHTKHLALPGNGLNLLPELPAGPAPEEKIDNLPAGSENDEDEDMQEGEYTDADETGDEPEAETEPDKQPAAEPPAELEKIVGSKKLGDLSVDELTVFIERKGVADTLKSAAIKVRDWKTRQ